MTQDLIRIAHSTLEAMMKVTSNMTNVDFLFDHSRNKKIIFKPEI